MGRRLVLLRKLLKPSSVATALVAVVSGVLALQFGLHIYPRLGEHPYPEVLSLSGEWEICVPEGASAYSCTWQKTILPQDLPSRLKANFKGFIAYQRTFVTPASCLGRDASCVLFLGEVGDAVEATLNGVSLGRRGEFPPAARYAKHYPATFDLSRDLLRNDGKPNTLSLIVYSMKKIQAGVRRGPVAILDSKSATSATQAFVLVSILIPLFASLGLLLLGLSPLFLGFQATLLDPRSQAYIRFCLAGCAFLLSFSEIPREYYPIWLAGYLHFFLRVLSDYAYFSIVVEFFGLSGRLVRVSRWGYALALSAFWVVMGAQAFRGDLQNAGFGFDSAYVICRIALPLLLLPHALGVYGAFQRRGRAQGKLLVLFFSGLLLLQIHDSLIFHGMIQGAYAVKFYPFCIGLVFGAMLLRHRQRELRKLEVAARVGSMTAQVAHDIRSPLAALSMVSKDLAALPPDTRELLMMAVGRIQDIATGLLEKSRTGGAGFSAQARSQAQAVCLNHSLNEILSEKRLQYRSNEALSLEAHLTEGARLFANVDDTEFKRLISNLVNNSVEATLGFGGTGRIIVALEKVKCRARITITDQGSGIPPEILGRLGERGVTYGKPQGSGLGLYHARSHAESWGGSLSITSAPSQGTRVQVELPLAEPALSKERPDLVLVDDDPLENSF